MDKPWTGAGFVVPSMVVKLEFLLVSSPPGSPGPPPRLRQHLSPGLGRCPAGWRGFGHRMERGHGRLGTVSIKNGGEHRELSL